MKISFFGTPPFAAEILSYLLQSQIDVVSVVTQPDKPRGRSSSPAPSAVKEWLIAHFPQIPLLQPIKASDPIFLDELKKYPADLFVVVAFGQILSQKLLDIPPMGCINVHASLLPKYRGAAPIQRAILNGEKETGVAIQKMVKELDAGDVIASETIAIPPDMNAGELQKKLCKLAQPLLVSVIRQFEKGEVQSVAQDPSQVSFAPKITPEEGEIFWNQSAEKIHNQIRAFSPKPGAWCWISIQGEKKRLKILLSNPLVQEKLAPGTLLSPRPIVGCGKGALELVQVQVEGKKVISGAEWMRGGGLTSSFLVG